MADKSTPLVLEALSRAVSDPAGLPLHGTRTSPGLFAATSVGKQAAQRCKDEGYLRVVRTETRGKTTYEVCAITEEGVAYLLGQVNPRQALEGLIHAVEARQTQTAELLAVARQMQTGLDALKMTAEKVLQQINKPTTNGAVHREESSTWPAVVLDHLSRWQASSASEDCSIPDLYRQARQAAPQLTIGQFHDGLRRLHDQERIYLHPWTGPLYEIPEPPYTLMVGHEIAYYVSLRK